MKLLDDYILRLSLQLVGQNIGRDNLLDLVKRTYDHLSTSHHNGYEQGYSTGYQQANDTNRQFAEGVALFTKTEAARTAIEDEELYKAAAALEEHHIEAYEGDSGDEDQSGC